MTVHVWAPAPLFTTTITHRIRFPDQHTWIRATPLQYRQAKMLGIPTRTEQVRQERL